MRKSLAYIFCAIGFGWAIIGGANIVLSAEKLSSTSLSIGIIVNFLLFIAPGMSLGAKGLDLLKSAEKTEAEISKIAILAPLLFLSILTSCADSQGAKQFLEERGFTRVRILGPSVTGGCVKSNFYVSEFEAKDPDGKKVAGQVCTDLVGGGDVHLEWPKKKSE